jgi:hypothetical protein
MQVHTLSGEYQNQKVQGRGYLEYIDVENQNAFKD